MEGNKMNDEDRKSYEVKLEYLRKLCNNDEQKLNDLLIRLLMYSVIKDRLQKVRDID